MTLFSALWDPKLQVPKQYLVTLLPKRVTKKYLLPSPILTGVQWIRIRITQ
jgi:hypothetical protein